MSIPSPCIGTCRIDGASGLCVGCARTGREIASWAASSEEVRRRIWDELPARRGRLGLRLHRLGWSPDDLREFLVGTLKAGAGTWVFGVYGAVAEFCVAEGEAVEVEVDPTRLIARTLRAALRFEGFDSVRALATEASGRGIIVLAMPQSRVFSRENYGLTMLGPDRAAIREADREARLYDLGLGMQAASFGIRTEDRGLIEALDAREGRRWPELLAELGGRILQVSPTRVVRSPIGRVEVSTPIPPPGGRSPDGPHTHFLPNLIAGGRETPPGLELPETLIPCAFFYPGPSVVPDDHDHDGIIPGDSTMTDATAHETWKRPTWIVLLIGASVAFSFLFACATPFVAFAAIAACTLPRRDAYLLTGGVWLANQAVGFAFLNYPWTVNCITWGLAIGMTAILSTMAARLVAKRVSMAPARAAVALLFAFAAYEVSLIGFSAILGGLEHYTIPVQGRILGVNAAALVGLFALDRLGVAAGFAPSRRTASSMTTRPA